MPSDERNVRKGEIVYICDGGDRRAVECDVAEWSVVERIVTVPVHRKRGGVALRDIQRMAQERSVKNIHQASCS